MFNLTHNDSSALRRLRDEVERLMGSGLEGLWDSDLPGLLGGGAYPALNVWETENAVLAELEVPGLDLADVELEIVGNELSIRGERKEKGARDSVYHRRERPVGKFARTVQLPVDVDSEKVEASLENGVLRVTLPKASAARPRKIAIRGA